MLEFRCNKCGHVFSSVSAKCCPKCGYGEVSQIVRASYEFKVEPLNIAKKAELEIPIGVVKNVRKKRK